ncbi:MAG: YeeE/YedE family protein [Candidatus Thiodiazotropha sp. (ex Monitilora ramsayi)]|nr:YeeE/YedE family protein [Candidatus Thiodiazotropha sp. (ex Monitilora ramsayi)]
MEEFFKVWLIGGGLVIGAIFGLLAQRSGFCAVSAISNSKLMRDYRHMDAYVAAIVVAMMGTLFLEMTGLVDISTSPYRRPSLNWAGALFGGLIFGVGAMLSGGCASRTLIRSAEGNIGAIVTLLAFALSGMATLIGVLDPVKAWVSSSAIFLESGDASLSKLMELPYYLLPAVVALAGMALIYLHLRHQNNWSYILYGGGIGICVVISWWVTGVLGQDEFLETPPSSIAVAGPLSRGAVFLSTGEITGNQFAFFLLPGMVFGAFVSAYLSGKLRWVSPAGSMVGCYLSGGILMGVGAVFAGGCNVGQGLSGLSTFSFASIIAVGGILAGMSLTLAWINTRNS